MTIEELKKLLDLAFGYDLRLNPTSQVYLHSGGDYYKLSSTYVVGPGGSLIFELEE